MSNYKLHIPANKFNDSYDNNTKYISISDISISDEFISIVNSSLYESYTASFFKRFFNVYSISDESIIENISISQNKIITSIFNTITYNNINTLGNYLIQNEGRNSTSPFYQNDMFNFLFNIKPGIFNISFLNRFSVSNYKCFEITLNGHQILIDGNSEQIDGTEWIYTMNHNEGPYYNGNDTDGYYIKMYIQLY